MGHKERTSQVQIATVVSAGLQQELQELADRNERSLAAEMRIALKAHVRAAKEAPAEAAA
jgi:hypothetical protein